MNYDVFHKVVYSHYFRSGEPLECCCVKW